MAFLVVYNKDLLNGYQTKCVSVLLAELSHNGLEVPELEATEKPARYSVQGRVGDISFWIYLNSMDFVVGKHRKDGTNNWIYELPDFDSEDDMIESFVADLVREAKKLEESSN